MQIDLQGYGYFQIKEENYQKIIDSLQLDSDFFLDLVNIGHTIIPILCINFPKIEKEGPIPMGHISSEIGKNRIQKLLDNNLIKAL